MTTMICAVLSVMYLIVALWSSIIGCMAVCCGPSTLQVSQLFILNKFEFES